MISENLKQAFLFLEMTMFPKWLKANEKKRDSIVKKIAKLEAKLINEEIKKDGLSKS